LTWAIYVKPLASQEPIEKEIRIFEEENKNIELKKELKATQNLFRRTMIFTAIVEMWVIVIWDSKEEVEIIFQNVVKEQTPQALELWHVEEEVGVSVCLNVQFLVWYWVYFCIKK
jgi:hypothetical protein